MTATAEKIAINWILLHNSKNIEFSIPEQVNLQAYRPHEMSCNQFLNNTKKKKKVTWNFKPELP